MIYVFPKNRFFWIIGIMGFTSIVIQIQLMRELLIIFYGNELSIGTILGVWLFWTSIGSGVLPRLYKNLNTSTLLPMNRLQMILAFVLPLTLWIVRSSRGVLGVAPGELIGYIPMFFITLITLAPVCLINGLFYTSACQTAYLATKNVSRSVGKVYLWEAIGSGIGGLIASLFFFRLMGSANIFLMLFWINLTSSVWFDPLLGPRQKIVRGGWVLLVFLVGGAAFLLLGGTFQRFSDRILWRGFELVKIRDTAFGNLAVTKYGGQYSFFENGLLIFTVPEPMNAEESVHFTLLEHPDPHQILLIGGGLGGAIREVLKHPSVKQIDYVELDAGLVLMAEQILSPEQIEPLHDPRVRLHYMDGRLFIKRTLKKFDAVIINLPNPYTAQINRFYTKEFFQEVQKHLNQGGIFSIQVASSENMIGPELADFLSSLSATLKQVYPDQIVIPGEMNRFIASNQNGILTKNAAVLVQRLKSRNLQTQYVREYYIPYQMTPDRFSYVQDRLHPVSKNRLNLDFKPIGYFYDAVLWATYFSGPFKNILLTFASLRLIDLAWLLFLPVVLFILMQALRRNRKRFSMNSILYAILGVGFTEISLEVILILSFQILYGYAYQQLAVLVAGYMVGLALGSRIPENRTSTGSNAFNQFRLCQWLMIGTPLAIAGILRLISRIEPPAFLILWGFPLLMAGAGLIGGYQFILANNLYLRNRKEILRTAGFLYGSDLIGSSAGALITSSLLIPILGIYATLLSLALINLGGLIVISLSRPNHP